MLKGFCASFMQINICLKAPYRRSVSLALIKMQTLSSPFFVVSKGLEEKQAMDEQLCIWRQLSSMR